jgi:hypothetical protein
MKKADESAFPSVAYRNAEKELLLFKDGGLTKREYFAATWVESMTAE